MGTDHDWEQWGAREPYFGVLTNPRYRAVQLTADAKAEFLATGQWHVDYVLHTLRTRFAPDFAPKAVLDFGCGVGRLLIPFARVAPHVVGVDVSPSMLAEARRNCDAAGVTGVALVGSDDELSQVSGAFDLVHSCIVLQHIEIPRGRQLFKHLVQRVAPGGYGALHVTFAWDLYPESFGQPPLPPAQVAVSDSPTGPVTQRASSTGLLAALGLKKSVATANPLPGLPPAAADVTTPRASKPGMDPEMQMNYYNLSELTFILQKEGVHQLQVDLTDHGGALGAFIFFHKPA